MISYILETKIITIRQNQVSHGFFEDGYDGQIIKYYNKILPLNREMILIYDATKMRDFTKKAYSPLQKFEIIKNR